MFRNLGWPELLICLVLIALLFGLVLLRMRLESRTRGVRPSRRNRP